MNAPEIFEAFIIPEGKKKVECQTDEKLTALYTILLEDHTLGNMLKMMLLRNPKIRFAAYRKPHPLENKIEIKIQTNGEITANEAFKEALSNLTQDLNQYQRSFLDQLRNFDSNK